MRRCCRLGQLSVGITLAGSVWADGISGKVVEDHSGAPLGYAEVRVSRAGTSALLADLETDAAGWFRTLALPPGDYRTPKGWRMGVH